MKRLELEKKLRLIGWRFLRHGGKHDVWTHAAGSAAEFSPRHKEIDERLARKILESAEAKS